MISVSIFDFEILSEQARHQLRACLLAASPVLRLPQVTGWISINPKRNNLTWDAMSTVCEASTKR